MNGLRGKAIGLARYAAAVLLMAVLLLRAEPLIALALGGPLLLLMTVWEREYDASATTVAVPARTTRGHTGGAHPPGTRRQPFRAWEEW